jgi:hypothetical protein
VTPGPDPALEPTNTRSATDLGPVTGGSRSAMSLRVRDGHDRARRMLDDLAAHRA